jgi:hypothetical protein
MLKRPALCLALLAASAPASFAGLTNTRPGVEISTFAAPSLGDDFDGHFGIGLSGALTATYDFDDSKYNEVLIGQFEGVYLHSEGRNDIGGPSHKETLDAGFGLLNMGLGMRREWWEASVIVGAGFGGGSLNGDTAANDLAMDAVFQVKPRFTWHFSKRWSAFAEYRFMRTSSVFGTFFTTNDDERALTLHGLGVGVSYNF